VPKKSGMRTRFEPERSGAHQSGSEDNPALSAD
jgi:hypothetical protein